MYKREGRNDNISCIKREGGGSENLSQTCTRGKVVTLPICIVYKGGGGYNISDLNKGKEGMIIYLYLVQEGGEPISDLYKREGRNDSLCISCTRRGGGGSEELSLTGARGKGGMRTYLCLIQEEKGFGRANQSQTWTGDLLLLLLLRSPAISLGFTIFWVRFLCM